jgi:hypothetical protein
MQTRLHYKVVLVYQMFPFLAMQFLFNHKKRLGENKKGHDEQSVWLLYTAHDFRARLRFPRVAREPPRQACGEPLFPLESSSCTPINR